MNYKALSLTIFLFTFLFFTSSSYSQVGKDTIYLDQYWCICERPIADYYRVAELKLTKYLFYTGNGTDYYITGEKEMTGFYDTTGARNGYFTFYRKDGSVLKEGSFVNDQMKGLWKYYNSSSKLQAIFDCNDAVDFTPVLIIAPGGDTVIKDGNGHFRFNTQKDIPGIFPVSMNYTWEGEVSGGKKQGTFSYWLNDGYAADRIFYQVTYKDGKFKNGTQVRSNEVSRKHPGLINLMAESGLAHVDYFDHSSIVFGSGEEGNKRVAELLLNGTPPEIPAAASDYRENTIMIFDLIGTVLRKNFNHKVSSYSMLTHGNKSRIILLTTPIEDPIAPNDYKFKLSLLIDTSGFIANSTFRGKVDAKSIEMINYYMSRLVGLKPIYKDGKPTPYELNIAVDRIIDTIGYNNKTTHVNYSYYAFNVDSVKDLRQKSPINVEQDYEKIFTKAEKEPSFPGGEKAWYRYLEQNLNSNVAINSGALNGVYDVTVQFTVDENGNISDVQAVNVPKRCTACGDEAVRIIRKGPKWEPAIQNGKMVKFRAFQNISFILTGQ